MKDIRKKPFPIQEDWENKLPATEIPWWLAEVAYKTYGCGQSLERIAERGGFGREELIQLIRKNEKYYLGEIV